MPAALEDVPSDAMTAIFQANLIGWHELNRQVLPMMRAQGHGRIVMCSSVLGFVATRWRGAYVSTKFALEGYADTLRMEMRGGPVHVSLLQPGPIESRFRANAALRFERWIDWENSPNADKYRNYLLKRLYEAPSKDRFELPASAVTEKLIHAIESDRPRARYRITVPTRFIAAARRVLPLWALDRILMRA